MKLILELEAFIKSKQKILSAAILLVTDMVCIIFWLLHVTGFFPCKHIYINIEYISIYLFIIYICNCICMNYIIYIHEYIHVFILKKYIHTPNINMGWVGGWPFCYSHLFNWLVVDARSRRHNFIP